MDLDQAQRIGHLLAPLPPDMRDDTVTVIGFETAEIDLLLQQHQTDPDKADDIPEIDPEALPVSRRGDLWKIGHHRLLCGDATSREDLAAQIRLVREIPESMKPRRVEIKTGAPTDRQMEHLKAA